MSTNESYTVVVTSDRYGNETQGLEMEQALVAAVNDLDIAPRCHAPASREDDLIRAGAGRRRPPRQHPRSGHPPRLENLPRMKVISRYGVGLDNVDLDAATDHGIVVTHYPGYCTAEVADHALALILALNRRIVELDRALRAGAWVEHGPPRAASCAARSSRCASRPSASSASAASARPSPRAPNPSA